ncbi:MAG TPA: SDR family NAD(P)-dependent oxidoreductase [Dehalococcoidia bacterium]|nr:SDR family NAD(P)-dependent oxidoreductase [Dehalococcoidia bacterium]
MLLKDRVAMITGGGRGIGRGTALRFAREGARLALVDLEQSHLDETAKELDAAGAGGTYITLRGDVSSSADVQRCFNQTIERFERLDILVNNAGIGNPPVPIISMPEEAWDRTLAVNLKSVFLCSKLAALQYIKQGGGGRIISVASQAGKTGYPMLTPYCASKAGIILFTQAFAKEVGAHRINVNCVCPGTIDTPLLRGAGSGLNITDEQFLQGIQGILPAIPLGRIGYPADVAKAITFLASDDADYMTGQAINISGGQEMH